MGSGPHLVLTWLVAVVLVVCIGLFAGVLGVEVWRSVRFARQVAAVMQRASASSGPRRASRAAGGPAVVGWIVANPLKESAPRAISIIDTGAGNLNGLEPTGPAPMSVHAGTSPGRGMTQDVTGTGANSVGESRIGKRATGIRAYPGPSQHPLPEVAASPVSAAASLQTASASASASAGGIPEQPGLSMQELEQNAVTGTRLPSASATARPYPPPPPPQKQIGEPFRLAARQAAAPLVQVAKPARQARITTMLRSGSSVGAGTATASRSSESGTTPSRSLRVDSDSQSDFSGSPLMTAQTLHHHHPPPSPL